MTPGLSYGTFSGMPQNGSHGLCHRLSHGMPNYPWAMPWVIAWDTKRPMGSPMDVRAESPMRFEASHGQSHTIVHVPCAALWNIIWGAHVPWASPIVYNKWDVSWEDLHPIYRFKVRPMGFRRPMGRPIIGGTVDCQASHGQSSRLS